MAKIVLTKGKRVLQELTLLKERVAIGRAPHNDIVIDDLAISGEHAVIVTVNGDSYLEDINSTNGTQVNGQPVQKHFLQDGDVIKLAQYRVSYDTSIYKDHRSNTQSRPAEMKNHSLPVNAEPRPGAIIKIVNGVNLGQATFLEQPLTTIGRSGEQIAAIAWKEGNYHITHVEGDPCPLVNGHPLGSDGCVISSGDLIEFSGTVMVFSLLSDREPLVRN